MSPIINHTHWGTAAQNRRTIDSHGPRRSPLTQFPLNRLGRDARRRQARTRRRHKAPRREGSRPRRGECGATPTRLELERAPPSAGTPRAGPTRRAPRSRTVRSDVGAGPPRRTTTPRRPQRGRDSGRHGSRSGLASTLNTRIRPIPQNGVSSRSHRTQSTTSRSGFRLDRTRDALHRYSTGNQANRSAEL